MTQQTNLQALCAEQLPELRGMFERILCVARSSDGPTVGHIQLADQLIDAVVSWSENSLAQPEPEGLPPRVGHILRLAEIIREVDGNHCKGAAALAEAILSHPAAINAQPALVPVTERFEFSVFNSEYEEQAGGTAPAYAEALSYGQHYLSQYSQDGPHSLEIRRVEVLPHHALPVPGAEVPPMPVPGDAEGLAEVFWGRYAQPEPEVAGLSDEEVLDLADDCGLEKQEITTWDGESRTVDHGWECTDAQLVTFATALITRYARPTIEPVPVAERPWEREGWCDAEGRCWWGRVEGNPGNPEWFLAGLSEIEGFYEIGDWIVLLPHHALPVPGAEVG